MHSVNSMEFLIFTLNSLIPLWNSWFTSWNSHIPPWNVLLPLWNSWFLLQNFLFSLWGVLFPLYNTLFPQWNSVLPPFTKGREYFHKIISMTLSCLSPLSSFLLLLQLHPEKLFTLDFLPSFLNLTMEIIYLQFCLLCRLNWEVLKPQHFVGFKDRSRVWILFASY